MPQPDDFTECPLCGVSVKVKNMPMHKLKAHAEELEEELADEEIDALIEEAMDLLETGKEMQVIQILERVVAACPSHVEAWNHLGTVWARLERFEEAVDAWDTCIEIDPRFLPAWSHKAFAALVTEQYDRALTCYQRCVELDSSYIQGWYHLGSVHAVKQNYEEALRCLDTAISLNDEYYMAWLAKGEVLQLMGKDEEGEECMRRAYQLDPAYAEKWLSGKIQGEPISHASGITAKKGHDVLNAEGGGEAMQRVRCSYCGEEMDCPEYMLDAKEHVCSFCLEVMQEGMSEEEIREASLRERELAGYEDDVAEMADVIFSFVHPEVHPPLEVLEEMDKEDVEENAFYGGVLAALDFILRTAGPEALMDIKESPGFHAFNVTDEEMEEIADDFREEGIDVDLERIDAFDGPLETAEDIARMLNQVIFDGDWEKHLEWEKERGHPEDVEVVKRLMEEEREISGS